MPVNWKRITLALLAVGLISGGYYWWQNASPYDRVARRDVASEVFGSQKEFDAFLSATNATVQRVHYRGKTNGNAGVLIEFGYEHDAPFPIATAQCEEMKRLLQKKSSYVWDSVKGCIPMFGMVAHFHSTNGTISVAFCFDCEVLLVFNSAVIPSKPLNGEGDFDPINKQLVAIAKAIFPNDPEIQKIK